MNSTTYTLDEPGDADKLAAAIRSTTSPAAAGTATRYGPTGPAPSLPGRPATDRLARLGTVVQIIAFAYTVCGLIVGATIALATKQPVGRFEEQFEYPYLAHGIGVAIGAAMFAVVVYAIGALCVFNATGGKRTR